MHPKRQYSNQSISIVNKKEYSTNNPIYMQLCTYSDDCNMKQSNKDSKDSEAQVKTEGSLHADKWGTIKATTDHTEILDLGVWQGTVI